jgi:Ni2+-binding GTPase involved in maturation of urease and hydrogenase
MPKPRLILLGGFLGSGKTTLMVELGRLLTEQGHSVGVVTNDQGDLLVDTVFADAAGLTAGEGQNGCFCCNFSTFVANLERITNEIAPDYIIAEPVGSCTDLVATVLTPLTLYHDGLLDLAAYFVLADAPRLAGEYQQLSLRSPITPREVLVAHQIAEAGQIVLSKTDAVSPEELRTATDYLHDLNPRATITACSARTGDGLDRILDLVTSGTAADIPSSVDIDYEVYATAEAEMGWYNSRAELIATEGATQAGAGMPEPGLDPEAIALDLAMALSGEFGADLIHGKLVVTTESGSIKVSVVGGVLQADVAREGNDPVGRAGLTLNLRATVEPEALAKRAEQILRRVAGDRAHVEAYEYRALIPGRPVPEHRIS